MHKEGKLYIVSTPIGNLADITLRAIDVLKSVDCIICEDTRVTKILLNKYGISKPLKKYNDHSDEKARNSIIYDIERGSKIAFVSDAGTPLISDPGFKLINQLREKDLKVEAIPGACAAIAALTLSGLPSDKFLFIGFLPNKSSAKIELFELYKEIKATLISFEVPNRLLDTLEIIHELYGESKISVCREITKLFEEVINGRPSEVIEYYKHNPDKLRGEIVLCIELQHKFDDSDEKIIEQLSILMKSESLKDAVEIIATQYKLPKKKIYKIALACRA